MNDYDTNPDDEPIGTSYGMDSDELAYLGGGFDVIDPSAELEDLTEWLDTIHGNVYGDLSNEDERTAA